MAINVFHHLVVFRHKNIKNNILKLVFEIKRLKLMINFEKIFDIVYLKHLTNLFKIFSNYFAEFCLVMNVLLIYCKTQTYYLNLNQSRQHIIYLVLIIFLKIHKNLKHMIQK